MSDYSYPYKDAEFIINELIGFDKMCEEAGLDEVNSELVSAVLEEAGRFGSEVIAPLNTMWRPGRRRSGRNRGAGDSRIRRSLPAVRRQWMAVTAL